MNHYETLGVEKDASKQDIKAAFRREASAAHPDREGGSAERMQAVNAAWACLGDDERRARYDECGDDAPGQTIEEQAHELLVDVFRRALDDATDMLGQAKHELKQIKERADSFIQRDVIRVSRLKKRRAAISAQGENLVHALIDDLLAKQAVERAAAHHMLKVHEKAAAMLAAYSSTESIPASKQGSNSDLMKAIESMSRM